MSKPFVKLIRSDMVDSLHGAVMPPDRFAGPALGKARLGELVELFAADVAAGCHRERGWGNSNYGLSKLAVIAYMRVLAREEPTLRVNACCPGYPALSIPNAPGSARGKQERQGACTGRKKRVRRVTEFAITSPP